MPEKPPFPGVQTEILRPANPPLYKIGGADKDALQAAPGTSPTLWVTGEPPPPEEWGYARVPTLPAVEDTPLMHVLATGRPLDSADIYSALSKTGVAFSQIADVCHVALRYTADMQSTAQAILGIIEELYTTVLQREVACGDQD